MAFKAMLFLLVNDPNLLYSHQILLITFLI